MWGCLVLEPETGTWRSLLKPDFFQFPVLSFNKRVLPEATAVKIRNFIHDLLETLMHGGIA
jgi:hypothetical protein